MVHGATSLPFVSSRRGVSGGPGVELAETRDSERWAAAADASGSTVTPFHSYGWLGLAARMTRTRFTALIACVDGADVGVVPWLSRTRGPVTTVNWLPFPYVGPLIPPEHLSGVLRALRRLARRRRAVVAQFGFSPLAAVGRDDLEGHGFAVAQDGTYVVDTSQDVSRLWAGLEGRARTKVRRAERAGVVLAAADDPEEVLARVVREAFSARGMSSGYTVDFPPRASDLAQCGLRVRWAVARQGDDDVGALVTLGLGTAGQVWQGGVLPQHRSTHANTLLHWDSIRWASENGLHTLDLVGLPDEGIEQFKSQFGGVRRTYPVLQRSIPGWFRLQRLAACGATG